MILNKHRNFWIMIFSSALMTVSPVIAREAQSSQVSNHVGKVYRQMIFYPTNFYDWRYRPNKTYSYRGDGTTHHYLLIAVNALVAEMRRLGFQVHYQEELGDVLRSCSEQRRRYEAYARQHGGYEAADKVIHRPLNSEHHIGVAVDLRNAKGELLGSDPEDQKSVDWLTHNAHRFGLIIRYPKGKEQYTGFPYKPWHVSFIGDAATKMYLEGKSLEEAIHYGDPQEYRFDNQYLMEKYESLLKLFHETEAGNDQHHGQFQCKLEDK